MISLSLPLPPSVNRLWRTGCRRIFRSKTYEAWRKAAGWELAIQRPGSITGPVKITVAAGRPDRRKRDLDNIATKAVLDLLTLHGVIDDDTSVVKITASWEYAIPPG